MFMNCEVFVWAARQRFSCWRLKLDFKEFEIEQELCVPCTQCRGWEEARYKIPGLGGAFCSISCVETALFGLEHCRWCGESMKKTYGELSSRLCGESCTANYRAHVLGNKTAALGTGKRFAVWLQRNYPEVYKRVSGENAAQGQMTVRRSGRPKKYSNEHDRKRAERANNAERQRRWRGRNGKPGANR